jgi:hypothetical protein
VLSNKVPAFADTSRDSCTVQGRHKRDTVFFFFRLARPRHGIQLPLHLGWKLYRLSSYDSIVKIITREKKLTANS